jgi:hypothetical protein
MLLVLLAAMAMVEESAAAPPPTPPAPTAVTTPVQPGAKPAEKQKLICKSEQQLGSKFAKRVCRTPEQIQQTRDESRKTIMEMQYNNHTFPRN